MRVPGSLAATLLLASVAAAAETLYVTDRLEAGVHRAPGVDSPIVALLPSGTALEAEDREGGLVLVRAADGTRGWVDAGLLVADEPAVREAARSAAALESERGAREAAEQRAASAEARLDEAERRAADAEASLVEALDRETPTGGQDPAPIPSEALREIERLAEDNQGLKQRVAELEAVAAMAAEASTAPSAGPPAPPPRARGTERSGPLASYVALIDAPRWLWGLVGALAALAFALGAWLTDWSVRRRHGGFRI